MKQPATMAKAYPDIGNIKKMALKQAIDAKVFSEAMIALLCKYIKEGKIEESASLEDAKEIMSKDDQGALTSAVSQLVKEKERRREVSQFNIRLWERLWVLIYAIYYGLLLKESAKAVRKANKENKPVVEKWDPLVVALCNAIGNKDQLHKVKNQLKISNFLENYQFAGGLPDVNLYRLQGTLDMLARSPNSAKDLAGCLKKRMEDHASTAKMREAAQQLAKAAKAAKAALAALA